MKVILVCIFLAVLGGVAHAEPATQDCSKAAKRKARSAADKAVRAKDYAKAIALLEPFIHACSDVEDPVGSAWLAGELAVAYEKSGQLLECMRLMGPLTHPKAGLQDGDNDKLVKAIEYNFGHCSKALDAKYAAIKAGGCTLTIDGAIATAAVPPARMPKDATAACVALVPGKPVAKDDSTGERDLTCPKVVMFWKAAQPAVHRQELKPASSNDAIGDEMSCCHLSEIAAGTLAGKTLVRIRGEGRMCDGGTGDSSSDVFYEWKGMALTTAFDVSVVFR